MDWFDNFYYHCPCHVLFIGITPDLGTWDAIAFI